MGGTIPDVGQLLQVLLDVFSALTGIGGGVGKGGVQGWDPKIGQIAYRRGFVLLIPWPTR